MSGRRLGEVCGVKGCDHTAVGKVWPAKQVGLPMGHSIPVCKEHLELVSGNKPLRVSIHEESKHD